MTLTFPEKNTFSWEEKPRWPLWLGVEMFRKQSLTGRNLPRRKAYDAVVKALEQAEHEHGIETVTSKKLKQLLIAAAQEHGWYATNKKALAQPPDPYVPAGFKYCRKCREIKEKDDFLAPVSPAKARMYGWSENTTQKHLHHLCSVCRHALNKKKAQSKRYTLIHRFSDLQLRTTPGLADRVKRYQTLHAHIKTHMARVRAAFSNVKVELVFPDGKVTDYQFRTDALRQFYESKKVLLKAAKDRLEQRMGEAAPLPDTWGMLLTREEQVELADLHEQAVMSTTDKRKPVLWTLKVREKETETE